MSISEMPTLETMSSKTQGTQFRFLIDVLYRHWFMVLIFVGLSTIAGGAVGKFLQRDSHQYQANADLVVKQSIWQSPLMADFGGNVFGPTPPSEIADRTDMHELALDVARALVQNGIAEGNTFAALTTEAEYTAKAVDIEGRITLIPIDENDLLKIVAQGDTEIEAGNTAEFAVRFLVKRAQYLMIDEHQEAAARIREELATFRAALDNAEAERMSYLEEAEFKTGDWALEDMTQIVTNLRTAEEKRRQAVQQLRSIQHELDENQKNMPEGIQSISHSTVDNLMGELRMLHAQRATKLVDYEPDSPVLRPLQEEIDFQTEVVMSALADLEKRDGEGDFWTERKSLYKQRFDAELEIANLDIQTGAHKRRYSELERDLPDIFVQGRDYVALKHKAEKMRAQLDGMLDTEFQITMALQRDGATVERRVGVQVMPTYGRLPRPLWVSILAGVAVGFIIGLALALMREALDTSIQSIEDANRYIGLEVIGTIPEMKFGKGKRRRNKGGAYVVSTDEEQIDACIVTQHDPKSPVSEAYRSFRTNFQFATIKNQPKTVMITSAVPGEGKTTTAVNFAVTMADRGMRVLIVDTDLRRPNVHRVLKMERGSGLADVLREQIPVKNVIRPTRVENLWIISSGRVPPNPSELIGSERMKKLMEELGQTFDFVICDAPSILVVTDPVLLATHVDSVALVVSVKYTKRETIQQAKKLLETGKPAVAGVVLNALEATRRHYYYYYYYYDDRATA